jgi:hypothetical protein
VIYVIWHPKIEYCCHPTSYILIYTVATHVDEFDVSEVIESDNDGSYDDGADIVSAVDDDGADIGSAVDDDEGSYDCGVDIGSDDDDDEFNEDEKH